jgi:hypothetical protein
MARLVILNGVEQGRVLRLRSGINRIGRSIENHLQVPDPSVSSSHCEVIYSDANTLVRDLNSTNGTFIDGEPIQEGAIQLGQSLQIGNIQMRLEEPVITTEASGVAVPELAPPGPPTSLTLPDGSPSCANHPEVAGVFRCNVCQQALCDACVRIIRRISGGVLVFCSLCAGACDPILPPAAPEPVLPKSKPGFLGRLTQTLKLPFRKSG